MGCKIDNQKIMRIWDILKVNWKKINNKFQDPFSKDLDGNERQFALMRYEKQISWIRGII